MYVHVHVRTCKWHVSTTQDGGRDFSVKGVQHRNRAFDGDLVAVQVLPPECWIVSPF